MKLANAFRIQLRRLVPMYRLAVITSFAALFGLAVPVLCGPTGEPNERQVTFIAFGDSTTASRQVDGQPLKVYATWLETLLAGEGVEPRLINGGVGGDSTKEARCRFEADVLKRNPDAVFVQFGINDAAVDVWRNPPSTEPRVKLDEYRANLHYFIRELRERGIEVVLMTPNPCRWTPKLRELYGRPPYDPEDQDGFNVLLKKYAEEVRRLAMREHVPLVDVYAAFKAYEAEKGQSVDDLLLDGMHPNAKGHELIAKLLFARLNGP